jgi:hypothetical protein
MVAGVSYDENALLFVQSLRPYLGPHGNGCLIALESLLELLHSEPAKKTLDSLRILGPGEGFKALTMPDISQKESKPATLFCCKPCCSWRMLQWQRCYSVCNQKKNQKTK